MRGWAGDLAVNPAVARAVQRASRKRAETFRGARRVFRVERNGPT